MYTPATKLPSRLFFQWGTPTAPNPTLAANLEPGDTTVYFSTPPYDHTGAILTGDFNFGVKNSKSYVMTCYVPAGGMAADGLSATLVQGVRLEGLDFTTEDSSLVPSDGFKQGDAVFCNISGVIGALFRAAINGTIATGGTGFVIGTEPGAGSETITVYRTTTAGVKKGILRWYITNGKVQYSNDGTTWVNVDDVTASDLLKVSSADTTAGYLNDKITVSSGAGATVTKSITSPAGNEKLNIDVALNATSAGVSDHLIYTPAFLTGDTGAEGTFSNWLAVLDGSFAITIDGTPRSITGINFTGVTSMADVAAKIQAAIRAVTGGSETCIWSTNHFVITS